MYACICTYIEWLRKGKVCSHDPSSKISEGKSPTIAVEEEDLITQSVQLRSGKRGELASKRSRNSSMPALSPVRYFGDDMLGGFNESIWIIFEDGKRQGKKSS
jgi:hypothetical protein